MKNPNPKLKKIYEDKGITRCELKLPGCWDDETLGWHHRHKRGWYRLQQDKLAEFNHTILCCTNCHQKVEFDRTKSSEEFQKLRGEEYEI